MKQKKKKKIDAWDILERPIFVKYCTLLDLLVEKLYVIGFASELEGQRVA